MSPQELSDFILSRYQGLVPQNTWGETSFFYNPDLKLARGTYFVTVKEKDGGNDKASKLDRDGIFRLNFGTNKQTFVQLFGSVPARPSKGGVIAGGFDFTETDKLLPHPVYGWIYWLCILNPSRATLQQNLPILDAYYQTTKDRFAKRVKKTGETRSSRLDNN